MRQFWTPLVHQPKSSRIEAVVVALVLLVEAGFGECWCEGEEQRQQKKEDKPYDDPSKSETISGLSLLPPGEQRNHCQTFLQK